MWNYVFYSYDYNTFPETHKNLFSLSSIFENGIIVISVRILNIYIIIYYTMVSIWWQIYYSILYTI